MPGTQRGLRGALLLALAVTVFFHLFRLSEVPRGIYLDEASIGYNAMTLIESGVDEHGERHPVYFKAMGEYKNPLYIYGTAAIFRLFGASEAHLRLTSAVFFLIALALFSVLLRRLYPDDVVAWIYGLVALGFMPHYFSIARVSFEAISELPFLVAILLAVQVAFASGGSGSMRSGALLGMILGLSVYSYSTNRLFSPLMLGGIVLVYFRRNRLRAFASMACVFAITCIPLLVFSSSHPGALTKRFNDITYLTDEDLGLAEKLVIFVQNYWLHISPGFLLVHADSNLRHTSGQGLVLWVVVPLALVGVAAIIRDARSKFLRLVVLLAVLAPVPAALTSAQHGHALRVLPLSLFLLVISCHGLEALRRESGGRSTLIATSFVALLLVEAGSRTWYYFEVFPAESIEPFEGAGYPQLLQAAFAAHPKEIHYDESPAYPMAYSYIEFYRRLLHLPATPPMTPSGKVAEAGTCTIFHKLGPTVPPDLLTTLLIDRPDFAVRMKCFE